MKTKIKQITKNWKMIIRFFLKYNDKNVTLLFVAAIFGSFSGLGISYLLSHYINVVAEFGEGVNATILFFSIAVVASYLFDLFIGVVNNALSRRMIMRSSKKILEEAIEFSVSDDYLHFVSKDQKDKRMYVTNITQNGNITISKGIISFIRGGITIIGSVILLFPVSGWWILPVILILVVSCLFVENHNRRKFRELFGNTILENREISYYSNLLTGSGSAYELTLFGQSKPFHERMELLNEKVVKQKRETLWKTSKNTMSFRVTYSVIYIVFILLILTTGKIQDAGTFFLVFSITRTVVSCAVGLGSSISAVYMEAEYIYGYLDYMTNKFHKRPISYDNQREQSTKISNDEVIRVEHLSFRYYNNEEVLKDVSFVVRKNEKIAIVGENGAGKTTLVNILLGLFDGNGCVCVNGADPYIDMNNRTEESNIISVMQNFGRYNGISLSDNVGFGKPLTESIRNKLETIMDMSKEENDSLMERTIGNEFGGIGLSGGQWQKVALLRGEISHKIVILDEPTASLDPLSEVKVLRDFMNDDCNNTKLIITHRLGCTRYADRIIVLDQGTVVEEGTYDELLSLKGKYYEMYMAQAELYRI